MVNQNAFLAVLVCCLLIGCSSGLTPHAKNIGVKDEKAIDGALKNYEDAMGIFIRYGVLTSSEGKAEFLLETYDLKIENKSAPYRRGFLRGLYQQFPEAQNRRRLCRSVGFNPDGIPDDLECKGITLSLLAGTGAPSWKDKRDADKPDVLLEHSRGALPPRLPYGPSSSESSSSTYTVFGPDGKMQTCSAYPSSGTVYCY